MCDRKDASRAERGIFFAFELLLANHVTVARTCGAQCVGLEKRGMLDLDAQKLIVDGKLRIWIDIDLNDSRAAYQRAVDFVGAKNLAYNLSSNWLPELGGSEQKRLKESLYPNDFEWSQKGRCAVRLPPSRMILEVWPEVAPLAVENFVALILGNRGIGQESGCAMSYKGCHFHRVIKGFVAQGGDCACARAHTPRAPSRVSARVASCSIHTLTLLVLCAFSRAQLSRIMAAAESASSRARRPASRTTLPGSR